MAQRRAVESYREKRAQSRACAFQRCSRVQKIAAQLNIEAQLKSSGGKTAQQIYDQENNQNGAKTHAGAAAISPATVAIVTTASAKKQNQKNNHY
jgi:hypothetical protein